jgi:hypothetical protein
MPLNPRPDNEVGVFRTNCCGRLPHECRCAWIKQKKVLKQQVLGGTSVKPKRLGSTTQNQARQRKQGVRPTTTVLGSIVANVFCNTGKGGGINPTCSPKGGAGAKMVTPTSPSSTPPSTPPAAKTQARPGDAHLHDAAVAAGKAMFGGAPGSGFVPHDAAQGVEHTKLSKLQRKKGGESQYVDEYEYVFYPSQPGKGKDVSSSEWSKADKSWADTDGKIYTATAGGQIRVVTADKPLAEPKVQAKQREEAPKFKEGNLIKFKKDYEYLGTDSLKVKKTRFNEKTGKFEYLMADKKGGDFPFWVTAAQVDAG